MPGEIVEVNGTRLYCEVAGADDAQAVVFIHGFSLDHRTWNGQVGAFSGRHRVVRYDLRGFGQSAVPDEAIGYQHQQDLLSLLDRLEIEGAALVGQSFGGAVAVDFVLRHPERVRALVTVGSVLAGFQTPELAAMSREIWDLGRTRGVDVALQALPETALFSVVNQRPKGREAVREIIGNYSGWTWTHKDPATWATRNAADRLSEIAVPTLVIVGDHELGDMRDVAEAIATGIPGATKVVLPGLGHLPNMEDAATFNRVVLDFLTRVYPSPA